MKKTISLLILYYLRFFARLQLTKLKLLNPHLKIVGVTGSAGKTSTILACQAALQPRFHLRTTAGSNSESGIPLNLLGLQPRNYSLFDWLRLAILSPLQLFLFWPKLDIYLIEMGIDSAVSPKNMGFLLSVVKPDIGIFLNVSSVHLANFSSLEQIATEKAKLVNSTPIAIINPADQLVKQSTTSPHPLLIKPISIKFKRYFLPDIYQVSFGAAVTLAHQLGISQADAVENIKRHFRLPPSRATVFKGIHHSTIIDSTYNSSPLACTEMLNFLKTFPKPRIAILGDMREIGPDSLTQHQQIYQTTTHITDSIISIGPETQKAFGPKAIKFLYWWTAAEYLKSHPKLIANSTILVKGSQNTIFLEELVKTLLSRPSDCRYLCRQSPYWISLKTKFKNSHS